MNKKRVLLLLMICALIFTLYACKRESNMTSEESEKSENTADQEESTFEETTPTETVKLTLPIPERGSAAPWESASAGYNHTVGLKSDGTVVAVGDNWGGQCNVNSWRDMTTVSAGNGHTVGLKSDGTVVAEGYNAQGQCDVGSWQDMIAISAGGMHTVGLKADGTVVAAGNNLDLDGAYRGQCNVSSWRDIVAISSGWAHTVGLESDGTVVATGNNEDGQCDVGNWQDIVAVATKYDHTVGLKSDGTVVAVGTNYDGQCNVSDWQNIVAVSTGRDHTVGLKSNGTVVAVGSNKNDQCDVGDWQDIVAISAGRLFTIGLKSDGSVVAVGDNDSGQCNVSSWSGIQLPLLMREASDGDTPHGDDEALPRRFFSITSSLRVGWELILQNDGSFDSVLKNPDWGSQGEAYPNGTCYIAEKSGKFTSLEKVNDTTYKMVVDEIGYTEQEGKTYIEDGTRYIVENELPIDSGDVFYLFLPGTLHSEFPQGLVDSVNNNGHYSMDDITSNSYVLYHPDAESAGYELVLMSEPDENVMENKGHATAGNIDMASTLGYSKVWEIHDNSGPNPWMIALAFQGNGVFGCGIGLPMSEWSLMFQGNYEIIGDEIIFHYATNGEKKETTYQILWTDKVFKQMSEENLVIDHPAGTEYHFEESTDLTAEGLFYQLELLKSGPLEGWD